MLNCHTGAKRQHAQGKKQEAGKKRKGVPSSTDDAGTPPISIALGYASRCDKYPWQDTLAHCHKLIYIHACSYTDHLSWGPAKPTVGFPHSPASALCMVGCDNKCCRSMAQAREETHCICICGALADWNSWQQCLLSSCPQILKV